MTSYLIPIKYAFLIFPFLSFLFTLPYILYQYHKYGSVPVLRSMIVYSFILYLTSIYFLVILPLPSKEEVAQYITPQTQLIPFQFIKDFMRDTNFVWNKPSTYLETLKNPACYQLFYNLFMTVPFGIYLRYYFKQDFKKTVLYTFLLSLFFELTQLSGLYGFYPRSYRLFDVDDLMINTCGGILGFGLTPFITHFLPSRDRLDEIAYQKGMTISFLRRITAYMIDWFFVSILIFLVEIFFRNIQIGFLTLSYFLAVSFYFVGLPTLTKGYTIGKKIVNMKIVSETNETPKWYQYLLRYFLLYFVILKIPSIIAYLAKGFVLDSVFLKMGIVSSILFLLALYLLFFYEMFGMIFKNKKMFYEKISHTENRSTVKKKAPNLVNEKSL